MKDYSNYCRAITFAFSKYGELKRKSQNIPYVVHPIRITAILRAAGFNENDNEDIMIAALFHDLIEDTETLLEEIETQFGTKIASIVMELTKPEKGNKDEWLKTFESASKEAKIIKMADRLDNLIDMTSESWKIKKQKSYAEQAKIILEKCGSANDEIALKLNEEIEKKFSL